MPKLYNKRDVNVPKDAVYIGRPSVYGNPYIVNRDGTREEVCALYESWVKNFPELLDAIRKNLRGKDLVCWCAPERCHGELLLRLANE